MKASNKVNRILGILCLITASIGLLLVIPSFKHNFCDIRLRHNEVSCSHTGVNPFKIYNRDITSTVYTGYARPDLNCYPEPNKKIVHAYPPWHTTFFWWFGWLPQNYVVMLMSLFNVLAFLGVLFYFKRFLSKETDALLFWGCLLMGLATPFSGVFVTGNYGCLLLVLSVCMLEALARNKQCLAGIAWSLMMIKPQVGVLLFWPLFWGRKFITIGVAVLICVVVTLWPAHIYDESPLTLILQISQLGNTDIKSNTASFIGLSYKYLGDYGVFIWMAFCVVLCGILSYCVRKSPSWIFRIVPVLLIFPYWTYSQGHDYVVLWPLYVLIAFYLMSAKDMDVSAYQYKGAVVLIGIMIACHFYMNCWSFVTLSGWIDPSGLGCIYHLAKYVNSLCVFLFMAAYYCKGFHTHNLLRSDCVYGDESIPANRLTS